MQSNIYMDIYKEYMDESITKEEIDIIKYLLHNMMPRGRSGENYLMVPINNQNEEYELKVWKNNIIMTRLNNDAKEYRDFVMKKNQGHFEYKHMIKKDNSLLYIKGRSCNSENMKNGIDYVLDIEGYDKYSLELIKGYSDGFNNNINIINVFDSISNKIGIVPDLEGIRINVKCFDGYMYINIELYDSLEKEHITIASDSSNKFNRLMYYIDKMDLFEKLENNKPFVLNNIKG